MKGADLAIGIHVAVPASKFGEDWEKEGFGNNWKTSKVHGIVTAISDNRRENSIEVRLDDGDYIFYPVDYLKKFLVHERFGDETNEVNDYEEQKSGIIEDKPIEFKVNSNFGAADGNGTESVDFDSSEDAADNVNSEDDGEPFEPTWYAEGNFKSTLGEFSCERVPLIVSTSLTAPILLILKLFPPSLMDRIVVETNRYASDEGVDGWNIITCGELMTLFCLLVTICLTPRSNERGHWYPSKYQGALPLPAFGKIMIFERFRSKYQHTPETIRNMIPC